MAANPPPFSPADARRESETIWGPSERRSWTDASGRVHALTLPPGVYPPREDTDLLARCLHRLGAGEGKTVFEVGCGSGALLLQMSLNGWRVRGCDVHPMAVAVARGHLEEAGRPHEVLELDAMALDSKRLSDVDLLLWNTPYLPPVAAGEAHLGPLEEASLSDPSSNGSARDLVDHLLTLGWFRQDRALMLLVNEVTWPALRSRCTKAGLIASTFDRRRFEEGASIVVVQVRAPNTTVQRHATEVESTNTALLEDGASVGERLSTDRQTAGRGRRGASWASENGDMACSWVVHAGANPPPAGLLQAACGLAGMEAVQDLLGEDAPPLLLKWPNDLLAEGPDGVGKLAGWLVEGRQQGGESTVVAGMGLNLARGPASVNGTPRTFLGSGEAPAFMDAVGLRLASRLEDLQHEERRAMLVDDAVAAWRSTSRRLGMRDMDGNALVPTGMDAHGRLMVEGFEKVVDGLGQVSWDAW